METLSSNFSLPQRVILNRFRLIIRTGGNFESAACSTLLLLSLPHLPHLIPSSSFSGLVKSRSSTSSFVVLNEEFCKPRLRATEFWKECVDFEQRPHVSSLTNYPVSVSTTIESSVFLA